MSDRDAFDARLAMLFKHEHRHVPADDFVASTMRQVRARRRNVAALRIGLQVAALAAALLVSPWLILGAARLNAAVEWSLGWTAGLPGAWALGTLAAVALLLSRLRS